MESSAPREQARKPLARLRAALSGFFQRTRFKTIPYAALFEVALIAAWALFVGRNQFDFDPNRLPLGNEVPMVTQYHYIWQLLGKCGTCILWNGFTNGGAPAFAELQGAVLHPLVIVTTLIWGVVNGAKVILVVSLFMAGLAQWWLARVMGLGWMPRIWAAALAVVGGHLAGRMENGGLMLVLSTASASLVLAPALELALTRKRSALLWTAVMIALTLLAGQGYIQIGLFGGFLTGLALFYLQDIRSPKALWKDFLLALGLAALLVGIFWVPLLNFLPNVIKDSDPYLSQLQPLEYSPLNLVIREIGIYRAKMLGADISAYIYINYIGWIPILLALGALRLVPREKGRLLLYFLLTIGLVYLISSKDFMQFLQTYIPEVMYIRNAPIIAGLAVPLILGLAAWSADLLLKLNWPKIGYTSETGGGWHISIAWFVVAIPLILSISPVYRFSQTLMGLIDGVPPKVVDILKTESAEWVGMPYGEYLMVPSTLGSGMKIAHLYRPWVWKDRDYPKPVIEVTRTEESQTQPGYIGEVDGMFVVEYPDNHYAAVSTTDGQVVPCKASANGGHIDVFCQTSQDGLLTVQENSFDGWVGWMDGRFTRLQPNRWLQVTAPAGVHTFQFRYRPWDVPLGLLVSLLGVALVVWLARKKQSF